MARPVKQITKNLEANVNLTPGNSGADCDLPVLRTMHPIGIPCFVSCWRLSWRERVLALVGGRIWLNVLGNRHPPVWVGTECPLEQK